jgi:hypothetical protein
MPRIAKMMHVKTHMFLASVTIAASLMAAPCSGQQRVLPTTPPGTVVVSGLVASVQQLGPDDLRALPSAQVIADFVTDQGQEKGSYRGPLLWSVLDKAGVTDGTVKGAHLRHTVLVVGRDGYGVSIAMGEIDPKFEGKQIILAIEKDGKALGAPRLVVPGDHHGGRAVRDVVRVEVD